MASRKRKRLALIARQEERFLSRFGQNIRKIREEKNLSVYDLTGDDMPIKSRQHWQLIENGKKNVGLVTIRRIAESLEVDPYFLFLDI